MITVILYESKLIITTENEITLSEENKRCEKYFPKFF